MATLGEAVRNFAKAQGVEVRAGATIGESVRAVAVAKGLPADGNLSDVINKIAENEEPAGQDALRLATSFFNELSQEAISQYMIDNSEAVMNAFGVTKEDSAVNIGTAIYDTLQGGETVSVEMNDGGILDISGHFDEGGTDTWNIQVVYHVPAEGTDRCFNEGSPFIVKGGSVTLVANPSEITNTDEYDMALCIYAYGADISGVTVSDGTSEFTLDCTGLAISENWSEPCIVDPNGATFTISVHGFRYPERGTVMVDGESVEWSEIEKGLV